VFSVAIRDGEIAVVWFGRQAPPKGGDIMGKPKLAIKNASKRYSTKAGELLALERINLDVEEGDFVSLVGPSGCGKTTLLWSIAGLHTLSEGAIELDGRALHGPHPQIGMMFQEANLLPWRTIQKNIEFPFEIRGQRPARQKIDALLSRVGIGGFGPRMPRELSGGMQQRASIVRALSSDPDVLLMDEPFGALDAFTRDEMNLLMEEIWLETRKTIILITHSIHEAVFLSNKVHVMSARPGRMAKTFIVPFERKRSLELTETREFFDLVNEIKSEIQHQPGGIRARAAAE
jgi:NitT/TauT family transport system ATP-binding protein